jgi:hypothetical protein
MIEFWQYNHLSPCNWRGARLHVVPAHRTASLITLYYGYTSDYCCGVRLLIPFSPYHLNTNLGNTKFFIPSLLSLGHCVQHNDLGLYL